MNSENKRCSGGDGCKHCGMDMDMDPYCVNKNVTNAATNDPKQNGKTFEYGANVWWAYPAYCKGEFWEPRNEK